MWLPPSPASPSIPTPSHVPASQILQSCGWNAQVESELPACDDLLAGHPVHAAILSFVQDEVVRWAGEGLTGGKACHACTAGPAGSERAGASHP